MKCKGLSPAQTICAPGWGEHEYIRIHRRGLPPICRAVLRPAVEAARERGEIRANKLDGYAAYFLPDIWRTDKALLAAGEILGIESEKSK